MSVAAAIRKMLAGGLTVEQALLAAEAMESEMVAQPQLTLRQARNMRYRLKTSQNVSSVSDETIEDAKVPPSLEKEKSPTPPKENSTLPPSKQKPAKRASALADDWRPDGRDVAFATKRGGSPDAISIEAERFAAHHRAKGSLMKDWNQAWQTWWLSPIRSRSTGPPGASRQASFPLNGSSHDVRNPRSVHAAIAKLDDLAHGRAANPFDHASRDAEGSPPARLLSIGRSG